MGGNHFQGERVTEGAYSYCRFGERSELSEEASFNLRPEECKGASTGQGRPGVEACSREREHVQGY